MASVAADEWQVRGLCGPEYESVVNVGQGGGLTWRSIKDWKNAQ